MKTRVIAVLALSLFAAGCAVEAGEPVVDAPTGTATSGIGAGSGGPSAPAVAQGSNQAPVVGDKGGHTFIPSTAAEPCDPDPQPWTGSNVNCPRGPAGSAIKREPNYLTPPQ